MNIDGATHERHPVADDLLSQEAVAFLADLQHRFGDRRDQILEDRRA